MDINVNKLDSAKFNTIIESVIKSNAASGFNFSSEPDNITNNINNIRLIPLQTRRNDQFSDPRYTAPIRSQSPALRISSQTTVSDVNYSYRTSTSKETERNNELCESYSLSTVYNPSVNDSSFQKIKSNKIFQYFPSMFAFIFILSLSGVYYALVLPRLLDILDLEYKYWIILVVAKGILLINLILNYGITLFKDPGRLPKYDLPENLRESAIINNNSIIIKVKNENVEVKWCTVSLLFKTIFRNYYLILFKIKSRRVISIDHPGVPIVVFVMLV